MTGTEKQVKWALEIQGVIVRVMAEIDKTIEALNPTEAQRARLTEATAVLRSYTTSTDASHIISTFKNVPTGKGLQNSILSVAKTNMDGHIYPLLIKLAERTVSRILFVKADGEVVYRG